jgi:hypothetical protein
MEASTSSEYNEFQLFHAYNRLVRAGKATALSCECGANFITRLGKHDLLNLWCANCDTWTRPGGNTLDRVRGTVEEWIL